jgi:hypothetical protein
MTKPAGSFLDAKTMFQTNVAYDPRIAIAVDAVVVHQHRMGVKSTGVQKSIESWQKKGFPTGRMFFSDSDAGKFYSEGKWDGTAHPDDVERNAKGEAVLCETRPYMLPTDGWTRYLEEMTIQSINAGADAILPEEPLAHGHSGYEQSFRDIWQKRYGTPWEPESKSPQSRFMTAQLKGELYAQLEQRLAKVTKERARELGEDISFILPIHSAYSNSAGGLVAPLGTSLTLEDVDGYIGQVWTGPVNWTAAKYNSPNKSFFASAYALYDYFVELVAGSGKQLWLLTDPVEDNPDHKWSEFEEWYRHCVVAHLFFPDADRFEVMPWPDRIFLPGKRTGGGTPAPESFRISILSAVQALQEVPLGGNWFDPAGQSQPSEGIGVAVADTLMWETDDPPVQSIYGMLIPLIQAGAPVSACVLERATDAKYLAKFKVIVLSYAACKPPTATVNEALAKWVKAGGSLIILDEAEKMAGPFWWNEAGYASPLGHLFEQLKIPAAAGDADTSLEKGWVFRRVISPRQFGDPDMARETYFPLVHAALIKAGVEGGLRTPGYFCMRRGPFVAAHSITAPIELKGKWVDLFDVNLPVLDGVTIQPGVSGLYRDVTDMLAAGKPAILHATHRLMSQSTDERFLRAVIRGPLETPAVIRLFKAGKDAESITIQDSEGKTLEPDIKTDGVTMRVQFPNHPEGAMVEIHWK